MTKEQLLQREMYDILHKPENEQKFIRMMSEIITHYVILARQSKDEVERMADTMSFPQTIEEFMEQYKVVDSEQVYSHGVEFVPIFRVKQWLEHSEKHGRWIEHHEPFSWMGYTSWTCSECDYEVGYEKDIKNITNYCPNCGARMDEVEE